MAFARQSLCTASQKPKSSIFINYFQKHMFYKGGLENASFFINSTNTNDRTRILSLHMTKIVFLSVDRFDRHEVRTYVNPKCVIDKFHKYYNNLSHSSLHVVTVQERKQGQRLVRRTA
jgi:hypothetical protein